MFLGVIAFAVLLPTNASAHRPDPPYCGHGQSDGFLNIDEWMHSHNRVDGSFKHVHHIWHINTFTQYEYESHRICGSWRGTCNGPSCAAFVPDPLHGLEHPEQPIIDLGGTPDE